MIDSNHAPNQHDTGTQVEHPETVLPRLVTPCSFALLVELMITGATLDMFPSPCHPALWWEGVGGWTGVTLLCHRARALFTCLGAGNG